MRHEPTDWTCDPKEKVLGEVKESPVPMVAIRNGLLWLREPRQRKDTRDAEEMDKEYPSSN
jgi:hypothetical protein